MNGGTGGASTQALFLVFLFLAVYNAGCMTALQLQHYALYPLVGRESFAGYMRGNNRAAAVPTIVPALLLLLSSLLLMVERPMFVRMSDAALAVVLNLVALASTMRWQRPLQGRLAVDGYDDDAVRRLIRTNWIRTVAHLGLAVLAVELVARALGRSAIAS